MTLARPGPTTSSPLWTGLPSTSRLHLTPCLLPRPPHAPYGTGHLGYGFLTLTIVPPSPGLHCIVSVETRPTPLCGTPASTAHPPSMSIHRPHRPFCRLPWSSKSCREKQSEQSKLYSYGESQLETTVKTHGSSQFLPQPHKYMLDIRIDTVSKKSSSCAQQLHTPSSPGIFGSCLHDCGSM